MLAGEGAALDGAVYPFVEYGLTGVRSAREIPRCEYDAVLSAVRGWDEYKTMTAIKRRAEK